MTPDERDIVFYDGGCGLCHATVRFVLARDRDARFAFAPLDGALFARMLGPDARAILPDSVVLRTRAGELLVRSRAVIEIGRRLGGATGFLASVAGLLPTRLLDLGYAAVARVRRRLFAPPPGACPIVPAHLRARFLLDPPVAQG